MKESLITFTIIWIILLWFLLLKKESCTSTYGNSITTYWKLIKYSNGCFEKEPSILSSKEYKQDYCIYKNYEEKFWKERSKKIIFFEKSFIDWDMITKKESYFQQNTCDL